jgi:hypothetical protein
MVIPVTIPSEIVAVAVARLWPPLMTTPGANIPTLTKLPENGLPEAEPSVLLELKPVPSPKDAGKLMNTASAEAFCGKMHGRENSKKRPKEERANFGQIAEMLARRC